MSATKWVKFAVVALFFAGAIKVGHYLIHRPSVEFSREVQLWRQSGRYHLFANEHLIFYKDDINPTASTKDTLIILHGYPTCSFDFSKVWGRLTQRFHRVVIYDFIGFGLSDKPVAFNYTVHAYADIYFSLMEELNLQAKTAAVGGKVHLLAHDLGDSVAQEVLARLIEQKAEASLASVALLNGGIYPHLHRPRLLQLLLLNTYTGPVVAQLMTYSAFSRSFKEVFGSAQPTDEELTDHFNLIKSSNGLAIADKLIHYISDRHTHGNRWVAALSTSIALAFINGPADPVSGLHMANYFKEHSPQHKLILLNSNVAHYPQLEAPEETIDAYFGFLQSLGK